MPYTTDEFAAEIKTKYPEYKDWDNAYLSSQIIEKYPEYKDWIQEKPSLVENIKTAGKAAVEQIGEKVIDPARKAMSAAAYGGAGVVKGASLGYVDPSTKLNQFGLDVSPLTKKRAELAGEFLGAVAPISGISKAITLGAKAAGIGKAARPIIAGLGESAATGSIYGAARKPEEGGERLVNSLNDAALFTAMTGSAQVVDKTLQWYVANHTLEGAYASARQQIIDVFVAKGANPVKAAEMADAGIKATVESGGDVPISDWVKIRKGVQKKYAPQEPEPTIPTTGEVIPPGPIQPAVPPSRGTLITPVPAAGSPLPLITPEQGMLAQDAVAKGIDPITALKTALPMSQHIKVDNLVNGMSAGLPPDMPFEAKKNAVMSNILEGITPLPEIVPQPQAATTLPSESNLPLIPESIQESVFKIARGEGLLDDAIQIYKVGRDNPELRANLSKIPEINNLFEKIDADKEMQAYLKIQNKPSNTPTVTPVETPIVTQVPQGTGEAGIVKTAGEPVTTQPIPEVVPEISAPSKRPEQAKTFITPEQQKTGIKQAKGWEVLEPEYWAKVKRDRLARYEKNIKYFEDELKKLGPKATTSKSKIEANISFTKTWIKRIESADMDELRKMFGAEYSKLVKAAISKGEPVPQEVIKQYPEFKKALDSRMRYEKGLHTSFANRSIAIDDTMRESRGYKVKRQDGKTISPNQKREIDSGVADIEKVVGPIADILRHTDLTIAHTSGTQPFLRQAGGLYSMDDKTVSIGIVIGPYRVKALGHELLGHWLDYEAGRALNKSAGIYNKSGGLIRRATALSEVDVKESRWHGATSASGKTMESEPSSVSGSSLIKKAEKDINGERQVKKILSTDLSDVKTEEEKNIIKVYKNKLGNYWHEPREIWARLVEQYLSFKLGTETDAVNNFDFYSNAPGYWTKEAFEHLVPEIEKEISRRINAIRGELPSIEKITAELSEEVSGKIGDVNIPIGMSIKRVGGKPSIKGEKEVKFENPEIEKRWQEAHGIKNKTIGQSFKEKLEVLKQQSTREFEYLPRGERYVELRKNLLELQKYKGVAADKAVRLEHAVTFDLTQNEYELFEKTILLRDLQQEALKGRSLPFGFTETALKTESDRLEEIVKNNTNILNAIEKRNKMYEGVNASYSQAMSDIGFDVSQRLGNKDYFHHQVLEYTNNKGIPTGGKIKTPSGRGFLKKRQGSELDINTDYFQSETEVISQMIRDIKTAKLIKFIDDTENIAESVKNGNIPDGYVEWQPREGNTFYMASTVPEKISSQIANGLIESIDPNAIKKVLVMGGLRKSFIIPEEVAKTLDEIGTKATPANMSDEALRAWKVYQLISPTRLLKYNVRNMTGDLDAVITFHPSAVKKIATATNELYATLYENKPMSQNMSDWFERGGMQSNLQFGEMGDIKDIEIIKRFYKQDKSRLVDAPAKLWNTWWGTARKATDFREALLRYSTYLDHLEFMKNSPGGKPMHFGASDPTEIMALSDIKDRAYWLSNDELGAYDKISVTGQSLRKHYIPFWSWKEANFKRYVQGFKNAMADGKAIGATGRFFGAKTPYMAYRIGKWVIRATAVWSALQAYNITRYPEEEKALPPDIRNTPHIILGKDKDGNVKYFSKIGALGDVLGWFGMDAPVSMVTEYMNGRLTIKDIAKDMAKAPINVMAQGLAPFQKTIFEMASGRSFFPDIFSPRTIRERGLYLFQQLGMGDEYKKIFGLPTRPYNQRIETLLYYKINPLESAYFQIQDEKRRWAKNKGKEYDGFIITPRSNALYNLKMAIRFEDKEAMQKYITEYYKFGGNSEDIVDSLKRMSPLSGIKENEREYFVKSLDSDGKRNLEKAEEFYNTVLINEKSLDTLAGLQ